MSAGVSVLSKKLRQGGVARSPLAETDLIVESLVRGIEDRLRPIVKTMVSVSLDTVSVVKLAAATGRIATPAMMGVIEVEDADTPALVACDAALANHLIDLTLGGDPAVAPESAARPFTAIDMALGRLHLDAVLQAFTHALGVGFGRPLTKVLRIRDQRQNLSQLRLAPDYIDVLTFAATAAGVCLDRRPDTPARAAERCR
jgi:flagellar motor switch protein FliM